MKKIRTSSRKLTRKLTLSRETLRRLENDQLKQARGGEATWPTISGGTVFFCAQR